MSIAYAKLERSYDPRWFQRASREGDLRTLSLDGGGIRGVFTAAFFAKVEEHIGPIGQHFDLIAGTSTGAIIAAGVALGMDAKEVVSVYESNATRVSGTEAREEGVFACLIRIFTGNWVDVTGVFGVKYSTEPLENALHKAIKSSTLTSCDRALVVMAANLDTMSPKLYMTSHRKELKDPNESLVNLLLATSAAPVYFAKAEVA